MSLALKLPEPSKMSCEVALQLMRYASHITDPIDLDLRCPDCNKHPERPVTGCCGHTRCTSCIEKHGNCICRAPAPLNLRVDFLVRELMAKMFPDMNDACDNNSGTSSASVSSGRYFTGRPVRRTPSRYRGVFELQNSHHGPESTRITNPHCSHSMHMRMRSVREERGRHWQRDWRPSFKILARRLRRNNNIQLGQPQKQLITTLKRREIVRELIQSKCYEEVVPHLAILATSKREIVRSAYVRSLAQVIEAISEKKDPRMLAPVLGRAVRCEMGYANTGAPARLSPLDLECIICRNRLKSPVTTPCGHTFCKFCIKRMIVKTRRCALCCHYLENPFLENTAENHFINIILASLPDANCSSVEDDFMPVFKCTVAYPSVLCHLKIIDPRASHVLRRILDKGTRNFGMVGCDFNEPEEYGTVLEVKDCFELNDGCLMLSTVGVTRFKILERISIDGVMMARVQRHTDNVMEDIDPMDIMGLEKIKNTMCIGTMLLLHSVWTDIESLMGPINRIVDVELQWWKNPDGPSWLWWLAALLPLEHKVKDTLLLTNNLKNRIRIVSESLSSMSNMSETNISAMLVPSKHSFRAKL